MTSQQRADWGYLIARPATSRTEDRRRGSGSILVLLGIFAFLLCLIEGIDLIRSGSEILGGLVVVVGLALMLYSWYWVDRSRSRAVGRVGGWSFDARSFLVGSAILVVGLFLFLDPARIISESIYGYGNLVRGLGFAIAVFGFVWCVFSLRD